MQTGDSFRTIVYQTDSISEQQSYIFLTLFDYTILKGYSFNHYYLTQNLLALFHVEHSIPL